MCTNFDKTGFSETFLQNRQVTLVQTFPKTKKGRVYPKSTPEPQKLHKLV
jgi:hypothetical protein